MQNNFIKLILTDCKVKIADMVDTNFTNKSFFGKNWDESKHPKNWGSTMYRIGALASSIRFSLQDSTLYITSSLPYARLQNEGGSIEVTQKMKGYFWYMYKQTAGKLSTKKDGTNRKTQRNQKLTAEAGFYKAMALQKIGTKIKIKQRQFVGAHPSIDTAVQQIIDRSAKALGDDLFKTLKNKI